MLRNMLRNMYYTVVRKDIVTNDLYYYSLVYTFYTADTTEQTT